MLYANDYNDRRVHIDKTQSNQEYYCPSCGAPLVVRKGDIRQHHFAHKANHLCKDTWERSGPSGYDITPWHSEWQSLFPEDNQEVRLELGEVCHRADVLVDRTVVEFQHSIVSASVFDDRNNFYLNLGYKVVWLFDINDVYKNKKISYCNEDDGCYFSWPNPKRTFAAYDVNKGEVELFFHIADGEDSSIFHVNWISDRGFETFRTSPPMTNESFLEHVGLKNGKCAEPYRGDKANNQQLKQFCEKNSISLSKQQERAILAVEGANLLLAVPGSGKTTVLINRIGHMVLNRGITPESILAITFTKNAAEEMRQRFSDRFGQDLADRIDFRTINSLCYEIYRDFCEKDGRTVRTLISKESDRRAILASVYKLFRGEDATETEQIELGQYISCIKNLMLEEDQIQELEADYPDLNDMYRAYEKELRRQKQMDYDDQMKFAHAILEKKPAVQDAIRAKYLYICVDEAQDTSKIQHAIIRRIAYGQSLFMVGDEDQSIYGFRAAYPRALLNFRYDYVNPYILRMEQNYRSTTQIVELAQRFISRNKGRYTKNMTAYRGDGEPVELIRVGSRKEQFDRLLEIAKRKDRETAFLYRDNESSVVLIDLLLRNGILFKLKRPEMNFFGMRMVKKVLNCLRKVDWSEKPDEAIERAFRKCYPNSNADSRIEVLKMLASQEKSIATFLKRIKIIESVISNGRETNETDAVILSTIHSSKGLEYDHVCLVDVYDGRFPSSRTNPFSRSKDDPSGEQEERRLFYVGMTRAKDKLSLLSIAEKRSSYIEELYPEVKAQREAEERRKAEVIRKMKLAAQRERQERETKERQKRFMEIEESAARKREAVRITAEKQESARKRTTIEQQKAIEQRKNSDCMNDIKDTMNRQDVIAIDRFGRRWVRCKLCNKTDLASEFASYGKKNETNLGICHDCNIKKQHTRS